MVLVYVVLDSFLFGTPARVLRRQYCGVGGADILTTALDGAERKGREAFLACKNESACPYEDKRNYRGMITWSRAFERAWVNGFREAKKKVIQNCPKGGEHFIYRRGDNCINCHEIVG